MGLASTFDASKRNWASVTPRWRGDTSRWSTTAPRHPEPAHLLRAYRMTSQYHDSAPTPTTRNRSAAISAMTSASRAAPNSSRTDTRTAQCRTAKGSLPRRQRRKTSSHPTSGNAKRGSSSSEERWQRAVRQGGLHAAAGSQRRYPFSVRRNEGNGGPMPLVGRSVRSCSSVSN